MKQIILTLSVIVYIMGKYKILRYDWHLNLSHNV